MTDSGTATTLTGSSWVDTLVGGAGADSLVGGDGVTASHDSSDSVIYNKTTEALFYAVNGADDTAAIQFAQLSAGTTLTASDVFLF